MGCGASTSVAHDESKAGPENSRIKRIQGCQDSIKLNDGRLFVFGVIQRANVRNRNGRVYPKELLKREADRYYKSHVLTHRALGELDHPNPHSEFFRTLTLENVSHRVLDYYWYGEDLVGYVEVLSTPAGCMLKDLYLSGCQLGMSSRGWATLKEEQPGVVVIQQDFELITFDFVSDPSTLGAFLYPVTSRLDVPQTQPLHLLVPEMQNLGLKSLVGGAHLQMPSQSVSTSRAPGCCRPSFHPILPMQVACEDVVVPHGLVMNPILTPNEHFSQSSKFHNSKSAASIASPDV